MKRLTCCQLCSGSVTFASPFDLQRHVHQVVFTYLLHPSPVGIARQILLYLVISSVAGRYCTSDTPILTYCVCHQYCSGYLLGTYWKDM